MSIQDPRLAAAMAEVQNVLDKYDIMGVIVLADGLAHAEWRLAINRTSWSTARFLKGGGVHLKGYTKSLPEETQRTTNAIINLTEVVGPVAMMLIQLEKLCRDKIGTTNVDSPESEERDDD